MCVTLTLTIGCMELGLKETHLKKINIYILVLFVFFFYIYIHIYIYDSLIVYNIYIVLFWPISLYLQRKSTGKRASGTEHLVL